MAYLTIDRLQKNSIQTDKERRKLSEFLLMPTKQLLLQDETSLIQMQEYLESMETYVLIL